MLKTTSDKSVQVFAAQLEEYRKIIDARIEKFVDAFESDTAEQFGEYPLIATKTFTSYLSRGGKRLRGALTMVVYELYGGKNQKMILEAALAMEMLQAYLLMIDDIQDRSETRRGGASAHRIMREYHEQHHLKSDSQHFGESIAMNALTIGCHAALNIIAGLNSDADSKVRVMQNIHRLYIATGHGQTLDIFHEVVETIDESAVENALVWKTAYYTFVNPLQCGAILAGASDKKIQILYDYSIPAGRAFQITDDILGIFGDEFESGKSPLDDIREGKRTILIIKTLEQTNKADAYFLKQCLGKDDLTTSEFEQCRAIITKSGALTYAQELAKNSATQAINALKHAPKDWNENGKIFLEGLANFLVGRKA